MNALDRLLRSFRHSAWANRRVLANLRAQANVPPKAVRLLSHLLAAERVWLLRLKAEDAGQTPIWPDDTTLDGCEATLAANIRDYAAYLDGLVEAQLNEIVRYRNSAGTGFETSIGDILSQVVTHGAYHRGQIALLLREAGLEPVNTDFITFVREEH